ncbi:MAG: hypothetical protein QM235_04730 [Pseudomonadota bacterium]|nr:hypothetical protein [Pseudomonadota bacterium]
MDKKEFEAAKSAMKEVVKAMSTEERVELVKEYRNELLWGSKRRLY